LKSWRGKWRESQGTTLEMNKNHSANGLSEQAKIELKQILRTEIGADKVNLLADGDLQELGNFLLVLYMEAIKRKLTIHAMENSSVPAQADAGALL